MRVCQEHWQLDKRLQRDERVLGLLWRSCLALTRLGGVASWRGTIVVSRCAKVPCQQGMVSAARHSVQARLLATRAARHRCAGTRVGVQSRDEHSLLALGAASMCACCNTWLVADVNLPQTCLRLCRPGYCACAQHSVQSTLRSTCVSLRMSGSSLLAPACATQRTILQTARITL